MKLTKFYVEHKNLILNERDGKYTVRCPFHTEITPSFTFNNKFYHCFSCGAHGETDNLTIHISHDGLKLIIRDLKLEEERQ